MKNQQSQVSIEDELVAVRVLSAIFVTFMVLIVGSYSDSSQNKLIKNTTIEPVSRVASANVSTNNQSLTAISALIAQPSTSVSFK